jgi:hypothetical protein
MSLLSTITKGKQIGAQFHVIAGNNGVGKTTWAASFPSALIIDLEKGSGHLDVARIPSEKVPNLEEMQKVIKELIDTDHAFQTVVIDSAEALEGLISDAVCAEGKVKSIELYDGGYGKGYVRTREIMRKIIVDFRALQNKGITVILVAHTQTKSHTDPATNQTYDRVIMRCNDKMAALIRDMADNVFYATYKVFLNTENKKTKAFGDGQRIMFTQWRPGFDAKNRLDLPLELPLSYDTFMETIKSASSVDTNTLIKEISEMSGKLDEKMKKVVAEQVEKFKTNPLKLKEVKNRLMKHVVA